ncbi:MAG: Gfo/Idh/MocA family oxidoreductase [Armatimonadetes bacterium]|nr:Gfo/Idh/MocA family oxidoreductase [Armatimonadota bacterium]
MRFAILGCGEAGSRRAAAISEVEGTRITVCIDAVEDRAEELASRFGVEFSTNWRASITRSDVDAVVIATTNNTHAQLALAAADAGKHILCERPLARNPAEAEQMIGAAREQGVRLKTGVILRYHPTVLCAREIIDTGKIGRITFIRGWTGRGAYSVAPPADWMVDCEISGGGTLLDNGIDLIDLCRCFIGEFRQVIGYTAALLLPVEPCEDNAFAVLTTADGRAASIHSSWTEWQGYLRLEISGTKGYIRLNYDDSTVAVGFRPGVAGAGLEDVTDLSGQPDRSLSLEIEDFVSAVQEDREPQGGGYDGLETLSLVHAIYRSSEERRRVGV